jgi:branched-chain amino acid transport system permease protein
MTTLFLREFKVLATLWCCGFALMLTLSLVQLLAFRRKLSRATPVVSGEVLAVMQACQTRMDIVRDVPLLESERIAVPILPGLLRPRIILPGVYVRTCTPEQLEHFFLHELSHLKRHDILCGWVMSLLCLVHWFNPLMWIAFRRMNNDSEEATDQLALTRLPNAQHTQYGKTLLSIAERLNPSGLRGGLPVQTPGIIGIMESPSQLTRRIEMIAQKNHWKHRWVLLAVGFVWPFFGSRGAVDIATLALIYVILGLGLNIVVGFTGLLNLGYAGFYAIGGYTYAILNQRYGLSFWECLPLSAAMSALFGLLLGFPVLRLRGDYLAIVTLGFGEIIRLLANSLDSLTGGPDGISSIPKPTVFGIEMARSASVEGARTFHEIMGWEYSGEHMVIFLYLLALLLVCLTLFVTSRLVRMPMGRAWEALREDEIACRSLGLNPTRIKLSAFTLSSTFAGIGGAFFAARQGLVNPESFTFIESALILAVVVLGGMGSQLGVILAAILLTLLPEFARGFAEYRMLIFGLVMVLMMIWRPQGLLPAQRPQVELPQ